MKPVKLSNAAIDGEVSGDGWRMALEIKSGHDDDVRGLGQLAEALAHGYESAALITSLRVAKRIKPATFNKFGIVLLGIDARGNVHQILPTYASKANHERQSAVKTRHRQPIPNVKHTRREGYCRPICVEWSFTSRIETNTRKRNCR